MTTNDKGSIKVSYKDKTVEVTGSTEFIKEMLDRYETLFTSSKSPSTKKSTTISKPKSSKSTSTIKPDNEFMQYIKDNVTQFNEFINKYKSKSKNLQYLVFSKYLESLEKPITVLNLYTCDYNTDNPSIIPEQVPQDLARIERGAYLLFDKEKKEWTITTKGELKLRDMEKKARDAN